MDSVLSIIKSSTPDGLAPLSLVGSTVFIHLFGILTVTWAILNLFVLINKGKVQQDSVTDGSLMANIGAVLQMTNKVTSGLIVYLKYTLIVCAAATLLFFIIIMAAVEQFQTFIISISYLLGVIDALLIAGLTTIASAASYSPITSSYSIPTTCHIAKNIANFIGYFAPGCTLIIMQIILLVKGTDLLDSDPKQLIILGQSAVSFAFGTITVSISIKITSVIYAKGAQASLKLLFQIDPRIKVDNNNPAVICRTIGQCLMKSVSHSLDYTVCLASSIAGCTYAGSMNVIGVDQGGEIIFDASANNLQLALLAISFALFFSVASSVIVNRIFSADTADESLLMFRREIYIVSVFLIGFLALAAYLALPAEFQINEWPNQLKKPYLAYVCLLFGLVLTLLLTLVNQILANHPWFTHSMAGVCRTGAATNIISGLAFGFFGNIIPVVLVTTVGFVSYFWLGSFGVGLLAVGFSLLIPNYLAMDCFFSIVDTCSKIGHINRINENSLEALVCLAQNRRVSESHAHVHLNVLSIVSGYCLALVAALASTPADTISINQPTIFSGLLFGPMLGYTFSATIIRSIGNVGPVIPYDLRAQRQQNQMVQKGSLPFDFFRANYFFIVNTFLQMKFMLPFLFVPFIIAGISFGPRFMLGTVVGMIISNLQLALSSGLSGEIWHSVRTEIFMGRVLDEDGNVVQASSSQGEAADVGNEVGNKIKDSIGLTLQTYSLYVCLMSSVMSTLYSSIHS